MRSLWISFCCALLLGVARAADPAPAAPLTRGEIDRQIAALGQRQVEIAFAMRDQAQKNEAMWADPKYTSPEIENLRKRLAVLKQEMLTIELSLRERVAELPEAQAELAKVEKAKADHQAIARQMESLQKQRERAP